MASHKKGGLPDVVAIGPEGGTRIMFVEYKGPSAANPGKQDKIGAKQDAWYRAALDWDLIDATDYVVAKWVPDATALAQLRSQLLWRKSQLRLPAV